MGTRIIYTYKNESYEVYDKNSIKKLKLFKLKKGLNNSTAYQQINKKETSILKSLMNTTSPKRIVVGLFKQNNEWYRLTKKKVEKLTEEQIKVITEFHIVESYEGETYKVEAREDYALTNLLENVDLKTLKVKFNKTLKNDNTLYVNQFVNTNQKEDLSNLLLPVYDTGK